MMFPRLNIRVKVPPIKSQGIKTKLVPFIFKSFNWDGNGSWVEPFIGSGVVGFNVAPKRALVSDTNQHLIRFYRAIQNGMITPRLAKVFLTSEGANLLTKGESHYYFIRE